LFYLSSYFDTVGWVIWLVKTVCAMTYDVLSGTVSNYAIALEKRSSATDLSSSSPATEVSYFFVQQ